MRLRSKLILVFYMLCSACSSPDAQSQLISKLAKLPSDQRTKGCLTFSEDERFSLFFQTQDRRHVYYGADQCFASSPEFVFKLRDKLVERGNGADVTHFILVVTLMRQQGVISESDVEKMNLPGLCARAAVEERSHCLQMAANAFGQTPEPAENRTQSKFFAEPRSEQVFSA
jgi:hypothetical protein